MDQHVALWQSVSAFLLLGWAVAMWATVISLALSRRHRQGSRAYHIAGALVVIGLFGQVGHLQEHLVQVGFWVAHPESPGWMSPWAAGAAHVFGRIDPSAPTQGMEILHLVGNLIFLAGVMGVLFITRRARHTRAYAWGRFAGWMQGLHCVEHLALTLSIGLGADRAIGVSTWFGLMGPGPGLWTYRIWWHVLANTITTVVFATSAWHVWRSRLEIASTFAGPAFAGPRPASHRAPPRHFVHLRIG